ncbi:MAG: YaaA family protein [Sandaracinaceae bacterium]
MYAVLAPAKTLDLSPSPIAPRAPRFLDEAAQIVDALRSLDDRAFARVMDLGADRAAALRTELDAFDVSLDAAVPAVHAFAGAVYRGLLGRTLDADALLWADDRVGIVSAVYGILRPLDGVKAHRLEMSARLAVGGARNLYAFWGAKITEAIAEATASHADRSVIDLASEEYTRVLWPRALGGPLVDCAFESWSREAPTPRMIPTHARRARGLMARFLIDERLERPSELREFDADGYMFVPERSTPSRMVFAREMRDDAS